MTAFFHDESGRLLAKLRETDPTTNAYLTCLQHLEVLYHSNWLDELAALHENETPKCVAFPSPEKKEKARAAFSAATEEVEQETVTPADTTESGTVQTAEVTESTEVEAPVTKDPDYDIHDEPVQPDPVEEKPAKTYTKVEVRAALVAYRNGGGNIKSFLANFGADNFSTLDESQWSAVMEALNA